MEFDEPVTAAAGTGVTSQVNFYVLDANNNIVDFGHLEQRRPASFRSSS